MLNITQLQSALNVLIDAFVTNVVAVFDGEIKQGTTHSLSKVPGELSTEAPQSGRRLAPSPPAQAPRRSLLDRPNVVIFHAPERMPEPVPDYLRGALESDAPKVSPFEDIAERAVKALAASDVALTFDQLRLRLRVTKDALSPVLEKLVTDTGVRVVEIDGVTAYKRPRIEPIRRRRPAA